MVQPGGVAWQRSHNWHGQETMCKVETPAVTRTVARQVMVAPPGRVAVASPAVYAHETRRVLVKPATTRHFYEPPVHGLVARPYVAKPATSYVVRTPAMVAHEQRQVLVRAGGYTWQRSGHAW